MFSPQNSILFERAGQFVDEKDVYCSPADFPFFPSLPHSPSTIRHILIIRPGALGDGIITLPTLSAIRRYFYHARIEIMGSPPFLEMVQGRFYADKVSRFDQADIAPLFMKNAQISESLRTKFRSIDIIISFLCDKERIFVENLKAAGARCVLPYEPFPPSGERIHIIDHFLKFLHVLDIPYFTNIPRLFFQKEDRCFGDNFIKDKIAHSQKILIGIHPGSGSKQKCWPIERYAELLVWLHKEMDVQPFLISGPADIGIIEELQERVKGGFVLLDRMPLPYLAAVIKRCNLFIGNDSGITHVAAAAGTRTLAIFGPTDPNMWGPRGKQVKILFRETPCSPCSLDTRRDCLVQTCLEEVKGKDVIEYIIQEVKGIS